MRLSSSASLVLAAVLFTTAGCGHTSNNASLTRSQLIAKADAICQRLQTTLESNNVGTSQDIGRVAPELASTERAALAELRKLTPPSELAGDWREILAGARSLAESTERLGEYARQNKYSSARRFIVSAEAVHHQMTAITTQDGFHDCTHAI